MGAPKGHPNYNLTGIHGAPPKWTEEKLDELADKFLTWIDSKNEHLFIYDFTKEYKISGKYFYELIKKNKRLSDAYEEFKFKQKELIVKGALCKKFNHNTMVFMMNVNHGIYQKNEQTIVSDNKHSFTSVFDIVKGTTKDIVDEPITD